MMEVKVLLPYPCPYQSKVLQDAPQRANRWYKVHFQKTNFSSNRWGTQYQELLFRESWTMLSLCAIVWLVARKAARPGQTSPTTLCQAQKGAEPSPKPHSGWGVGGKLLCSPCNS